MEHPLLQSYGPFEGWQLLAILGTISIGFFTYQVQKAVRLVMIGSSDDRFDSWGTRIGVFLSGWLGQKKVLRDRVAGTMHVLMFWGFLMLASDMFDLATANYFSGELLPELVVGPWNGMVELGYASAFLGASAALFRRVVIRPEKLRHEPQFEGNAILVTILTICATAFIVEAGENPSATWEPIGHMVAGWISDFTYFDILVIYSYWLHMACLAGFLIAIPASKHMHLVMAVPNVFFHDTGPAAKMRPLALGEDGKAVPLEELDRTVRFLTDRIKGVPKNQLMMMKMTVNQAYENMGLASSQTIATLFDGIARHSPEGVQFKKRAEEVGFKQAVAERDSGEPIPGSRN